MSEVIHLEGPYMDMLSLRHEGYCCSQIVVKLMLKEFGWDNPGLVRAMAALCFGTGGSCGILTGAACALSLCLTDRNGRELPDPMFQLMLDELTGWFTVKAERDYGGVSCEQILQASPDKRACSQLLVGSIEKLTAMLAAR